jgi:hypothetical protein
MTRLRNSLANSTDKIFFDKSDGDFEWCSSCQKEVPKKIHCLIEHYTNRSHKRLALIEDFYPIALSYGIDWVPSKKSFFCVDCQQTLQVDANELKKHIEKRHSSTKFFNIESKEDLVNSNDLEVLVFKKKIWMVDFSLRNDLLNKELSKCNVISSPAIIYEEGPLKHLVLNLVNDVFTIEELKKFSKATSYLEKNGNYVNRSEAKGSSNIAAFGMRSTYGDTGW